MTRPTADALARKALAFDLSVRERRELERKAAAFDRLRGWLDHRAPELAPVVSIAEILAVLEGK